MTDQLARVRRLFEASIDLKREVLETQAEVIVEMARVVASCVQAGGKVLFCGNGGSAADAQHLAAELLVRLRPERDRGPLSALALGTDAVSLTACANDFGFEGYHERLVQALGQRGDVLIGITTSGRSPNVVRALAAARRQGLTTLGLLGGDGGAALEHCDLALVVPAGTTGRVQEVHITAGHAMLEAVEDLLEQPPE